jgi:hypothetical protein
VGPLGKKFDFIVPRSLMKSASIFLLLSLLAFADSMMGQAPTRGPVNRPALVFRARPTKQLFARGEDVVFAVSIRNESAGPVLVSRLLNDEFVDFHVCGPDGKDVAWRGKSRIDSKSYSPSDFAVLKGGEMVRARRTISLKNGHGFVLGKPGQYSVIAEYSLEPPEYFAPFAGEAKVPAGSFGSVKATFCIEICGPDSPK